MDLYMPRSIALQFIKEYQKHKVVTAAAFAHAQERWVDSDEFTDEQMAILRSLVRDELASDTSPPNSKYRRNLKEMFRDLDGILNLAEYADREDVPPKATFKMLQPIWDAYVKRVAKRGWVIATKGASTDCGAWLYLGSHYRPLQRGQYGTTPEHWEYGVIRMFRGRLVKESYTVSVDKVEGCKTFAAIAKSIDCLPASEAFVDDYDGAKVLYEKHRALIGEQYLGVSGKVGVFTTGWRNDDEESSSLHGKELDLSAGGRPTRVVIDDDVSFADKSRDAHIPSEYEEAEIPDATVIRCFSLDHHVALAIPVRALIPYAYDDKVVDKLILPAEVKTLVHTLLKSSLDGTSSVTDVVRNKMGGTTILSHGKPGTGKTLTAEVFSETMKRPLYVVQCSQLGLEPDTIEKKLNRVLQRAEKWKAILLLDEADVYVMRRGDNINQNAIVGVFLRVMEYFDGIMVLTTNRGDCVDDAIRSRCIAEIPYEIPTDADRPFLWNLLCTHYGLTLTTKEANTLAKTYPDFSGRDIKQLARLVRVNARDATGTALIKAFATFAKFKPCHVAR